MSATISDWCQWAGLQLARPCHTSIEMMLEDGVTKVTPGEYGDLDNWYAEVGVRTVSVAVNAPMALLTLPGVFVGAGVERFGDWLSGKRYTHLRSDAPEPEFRGELSVLNLNACMFQMGLPCVLDGIAPASRRVEALAEFIRDRDPDVVSLQEMGHQPSRELWSLLRDLYPHGFVRIDAQPPFSIETCLMVLCKHRVEDANVIAFPDQSGMRRGAFWIETAVYRLLTTHLDFGDRVEPRGVQLGLIKAWTAQSEKPTIVTGDFNQEGLTPFEGFEDCSTDIEFTCHNPKEVRRRGAEPQASKIDYLWTKGLSGEVVVEDAGSDHLALLSRLILSSNEG